MPILLVISKSLLLHLPQAPELNPKAKLVAGSITKYKVIQDDVIHYDVTYNVYIKLYIHYIWYIYIYNCVTI